MTSVKVSYRVWKQYAISIVGLDSEKCKDCRHRPLLDAELSHRQCNFYSMIRGLRPGYSDELAAASSYAAGVCADLTSEFYRTEPGLPPIRVPCPWCFGRSTGGHRKQLLWGGGRSVVKTLADRTGVFGNSTQFWPDLFVLGRHDSYPAHTGLAAYYPTRRVRRSLPY